MTHVIRSAVVTCYGLTAVLAVVTVKQVALLSCWLLLGS